MINAELRTCDDNNRYIVRLEHMPVVGTRIYYRDVLYKIQAITLMIPPYQITDQTEITLDLEAV